MKIEEQIPIFKTEEDSSSQNKENSSTQEEKVETTENRINKIDEIFNNLLDRVKDAPEVQKEALKILIGQMKQIGEQMKQVRDIKNLQEIKILMMRHWDELNESASGNPELLKSIQSWGKKFVEEKIVYHEMVEEVKDELIDKSQEVQEAHDDLILTLGEACGLLEYKGHAIQALYVNQSRECFNFSTGLEKFIENLAESETGFNDDDILISEANKFLENINGVIMKISLEAYSKTHNIENPEERFIDKRPELKKLIETLKQKKGILSKSIKDTSKIFKVIKKIRDTHFLQLFNEK
jgi:hypothetical protein